MLVELTLADRLIVRDHLSEKIKEDLEALKNPKADLNMTNFYRGRIDLAEEMLRELEGTLVQPNELEAS